MGSLLLRYWVEEIMISNLVEEIALARYIIEKTKPTFCIYWVNFGRFLHQMSFRLKRHSDLSLP
jgi:hypothetical protein